MNVIAIEIMVAIVMIEIVIKIARARAIVTTTTPIGHTVIQPLTATTEAQLIYERSSA